MSIGTDRAKQAARDLIDDFGVKAPPVPIERIVKSKNILLQYAPLDEKLSGMAFFKNGVGLIGINALHHPNRQRFSIAHELAHHVLHRKHIETAVHVDKEILVLRRDELASQGVDRVEIEANAFAAELLIPEKFLVELLGGDSVDIEDDERIEGLARKFRVSTSAMRYKLATKP